MFSCVSLDKSKGIDLLNKAIELVRAEIEAAGGKCDVKMAVRPPCARTAQPGRTHAALVVRGSRER